MDDFDELLGGIRLARIGIAVEGRQILPHVFLQHLGHQAIDRAARRGDALEEVRTARFAGKRTFDRVHLTAQPAHPVDQTALVAERA